jgi:hypothetical protein
MKLMDELESEKRTCVIRLRHMEAYCHSASSPPQTPPSVRSSLDSSATTAAAAAAATTTTTTPHHPSPLYRKVTEKDFNNLAQQYRERDTMESLHRSKIEVLRGRQEKQYSDFTAKKAREMRDLEARHAAALARAEMEFRTEEEAVKAAFAEKKARLERRWRLESMVLVERGRLERSAALKLAMPPPPPPITTTTTTTLGDVVVGRES